MSDAEKLSDLPTKDGVNLMPHENDVMNRFFGNSSPSKKSGGKVDWKLVGYVTILFAALANPWIDIAMSRIPHCKDYPIILFAIKVMIFVLAVVLISRYAL
jgi:hypothetical protein